MPSFRMTFVGRCGFLYLLEEGCHSAGFNTTIHERHHLLLSLRMAIQFVCPRVLRTIMSKVCHRINWLSMGFFNSHKFVIITYLLALSVKLSSQWLELDTF